MSTPRAPRGRTRELERILSKLGLGSRVQAREWIRAGRVMVNGRVVRDPSAWFVPEDSLIQLDQQRADTKAPIYLALHKPRGVLTTRRDPEGRRTVYDLLGEHGGEWIAPVGRLDRDTSGLLLFTNDTAFAELVTSPLSHVAKCYRVDVRPRLADAELERLRSGVVLEDGRTHPAEVELVHAHGPTMRLLITIDEGQNRQVRRMIRAVGSKVQQLVRISIGPLELGELASGHWRELKARDRKSVV